jgi:hypothetical protein
MLYNDTISYSQPGVSFQGTLQINVTGISAPIVINDIQIILLQEVDHSNATTIGVVSVNYVSSGFVVIEANSAQAQAISESSVISLSSTSNVTIENISSYSGVTAEAFVLSNTSESEISIEY